MKRNGSVRSDPGGLDEIMPQLNTYSCLAINDTLEMADFHICIQLHISCVKDNGEGSEIDVDGRWRFCCGVGLKIPTTLANSVSA